jgi:acyl dehydratase
VRSAVVGAATLGESFGERVTFAADAIREFATLCGDRNPLHHDEAFAARSAFGTIIACGPHVTARMMGHTATHFAQVCQPLGLEFAFRFVRAVPAGTTLDLEWTVTELSHKPSLSGDIVALEGRAIDEAGAVYVTSHGRLLLRPKTA